MVDKTKLIIGGVIAILLLVLAAIGGALIAKHFLQEKEPAATPQPNISLNVDGTKTQNPAAPQVVYLQGQDTQTHTIEYVQKERDPITGEREKTDVQLNTADRHVYVKVNGKEHEIKPDVEETQKFENGKLVVEEKQTSSVEITAPKPAKWKAIVMYNPKDKEFGGGIGYSLSNTVQLNAMVFRNRPWLGLEFSIGDMNSRDVRRDDSRKENEKDGEKARKRNEKTSDPEAGNKNKGSDKLDAATSERKR